MKQILLTITLSLLTQITFANVAHDVNCISKDGLELSVPKGANFYMQPITLKNDYDVRHLGDLIRRLKPTDTTDGELKLNVQLNNCSQNGSTLECHDDQAFGFATYGYSVDEDYVTVQTHVSGKTSLQLSRDKNGIFNLQLEVKNESTGGVLIINKSFGPLIDPSQNSLTPWSPGCLISKK